MLHKPVLLREIISSLNEMNKPLSILDATFGRGGHSKSIFDTLENVNVTAIDRDLESVLFAKNNFEYMNPDNFSIHHMNFCDAYTLKKYFDAVIVDLGMSSTQLDKADRGFSFRLNGPLDMRMDQSQKLTASYLVNNLSYKQLCELFKEYGEVRSPQKVVNAIIHHRKKKKIETTLELADIISSHTSWKRSGHHPATNFFMALRIRVNSELDSLSDSIESFIDMLNPGGRLMVISFHSLEDRIIKFIFKDHNMGKRINKKVIKPDNNEIKDNPRSRSAKLRIFEKCLTGTSI